MELTRIFDLLPRYKKKFMSPYIQRSVSPIINTF